MVFPADLARINPLGKVPALVMDDSTTLFDSRVIVEYLDGLSPVHRLIPEASVTVLPPSAGRPSPTACAMRRSWPGWKPAARQE